MVTDQQVRRLIVISKIEETKSIAASKAGMGDKTARKYLKLGVLPSEVKKDHTWKTRSDPFETVWEELKEMLQRNGGLEAKTIFQYLQREKPGEYQNGQLRTLQRKIRDWRATEGPAKEVYFTQEHHPGELSESDFTHMGKLGVTIQGQPFDHMIYHFVLTYSNWEAGTICFSESFESLSEGYQNAVWELGGVTKKHRTDRMSAAVNKDCNPDKFTRRYISLMSHYDVTKERINSGQANENGDVEQRHNRFKNTVDQSLMLRGSRDFHNRQDYEEFLRQIFKQSNEGRKEKLREELALLGKLPARRLESYKQEEVTVCPSSTIHVQHNTYSVHSRLIKAKVQVRIYLDYLEVWYGQKIIEQIPRLSGEGKHRIQYRHIIDWLVRKPGAFENYRYQSDMFPSSCFRMAYDCLLRDNSLRANKEYVNILYLAAREGEVLTERVIHELLSQGLKISAEVVRKGIRLGSQLPAVTDVTVEDIPLGEYDQLLSAGQEGIVNG
ncbi:MAG: IS21 family transposase [Elusimicrobiota bacterium]